MSGTGKVKQSSSLPRKKEKRRRTEKKNWARRKSKPKRSLGRGKFAIVKGSARNKRHRKTKRGSARCANSERRNTLFENHQRQGGKANQPPFPRKGARKLQTKQKRRSIRGGKVVQTSSAHGSRSSDVTKGEKIEKNKATAEC